MAVRAQYTTTEVSRIELPEGGSMFDILTERHHLVVFEHADGDVWVGCSCRDLVRMEFPGAGSVTNKTVVLDKTHRALINQALRALEQ